MDRGTSIRRARRRGALGWLTAALVALALAGCGAWESVPGRTPSPQKAFSVPERRIDSSSIAALKAFEQAGEAVYRLGAGDEIGIDVAARPEISGRHLIGPDGQITLPIAGGVEIGGLTREEAARRIFDALSPYYLDLFVTVRVDRYGSNRIVVLGRVENPGVLQFDTPPTLLETLAQAGGLPLLRKEQLLTRCAVVRGDQILWVDLARLLTGDLALNIRLQRNDLVYIPDSFDTPVYVLGAVTTPGVYRLTPQMSFLDALSQAGGPTKDANLNRIHVIRPDEQVHLTFSMKQLLEPDPSLNIAMEEGDVIYLQRSGIAKVGYILQQINPFSSLLVVNQLASQP
ncbi:SLBB domain-containing protein [Thiococcus pfennigii]|uniref:SLBB domain-containing protein n=1 Tax=Thiococcus pfennigii TaxID=1057 RepID=UPI00190536E0|nr:SLBB domain-containing protein [Thiococcus pfennigii]MBK1699970.1 capsule biosynthesis protein CapA [Thiococcus pfennigii]